MADWNTAPAGNVSTKVTPLRFWLPPAANVIPTRYVYGVSTCGGTPAGTTFFVTVQSDAARDVTITWFEVTGLALDARIVPEFTACVPTAVPGGNSAVIETCAVVPAAMGVNSVKTAVPVLAS